LVKNICKGQSREKLVQSVLWAFILSRNFLLKCCEYLHVPVCLCVKREEERNNYLTYGTWSHKDFLPHLSIS
jgi:hypothetical protein